MQSAGLIYQIAEDKVLLYFLASIAFGALGFGGYIIKSIKGLTCAVNESKVFVDNRIVKLEQIMSSLAESLNAQEQRVRKLEYDFILLKAEAVKMKDFKRFEQQMEILGGENTAKAVVHFVKNEVARSEEEIERLRQELNYGRRAGD